MGPVATIQLCCDGIEASLLAYYDQFFFKKKKYGWWGEVYVCAFSDIENGLD